MLFYDRSTVLCSLASSSCYCWTIARGPSLFSFMNPHEQLYCKWNPHVLGLLSCSYSWFSIFIFAFSSFLHAFMKSPFLLILLDLAIIGDGDRKSWDPRGTMTWDNFSIFRTNCAILTSYIHAPVVVSRVDVVTLRDQCKILLRIFHSDGRE